MIVMVVDSNTYLNNERGQKGYNPGSERNSFNPLNYYLSLYEEQEEVIANGGQLITVRYPDGGSVTLPSYDPNLKWHEEQAKIQQFFNTIASNGPNSSKQELATAEAIFGTGNFIDNGGGINYPEQIKSVLTSSALNDENLSLASVNEFSGALGPNALRSLSTDIASLQDQLVNHSAFFSLSPEQLDNLKSENNLASDFNFTKTELASVPVGDLKKMLNYLDKQA